MAKKQKKHLVLKILLSILVVLILAVGIFTAANRELVGGALSLLKSAPGNNLKAAWIFLTGDSDTIQQQISDNDAGYHEAVQKIAEELGDQSTLDLSEYTLELLNSGKLSEEEMVQLLLGAQQSPESDAPNTEPDSTPTDDRNDIPQNVPSTDSTSSIPTTSVPATPDTPTEQPAPSTPSQSQPPKVDTPSTPVQDNQSSQPSQSTQNGQSTATVDTSAEEIAACIAKLYVLKSNFTGKLTSMEREIIDAYESLPKEEHTPASRKRIAGEYIKTVSQLEQDCDAQVDTLLSDLTAKLVAQGKDTAVVDTLRQSYEKEKSLKKAYYLDVYMNGI